MNYFLQNQKTFLSNKSRKFYAQNWKKKKKLRAKIIFVCSVISSKGFRNDYKNKLFSLIIRVPNKNKKNRREKIGKTELKRSGKK